LRAWRDSPLEPRDKALALGVPPSHCPTVENFPSWTGAGKLRRVGQADKVIFSCTEYSVEKKDLVTLPHGNHRHVVVSL
jgi:hypothetical protein